MRKRKGILLTVFPIPFLLWVSWMSSALTASTSTEAANHICKQVVSSPTTMPTPRMPTLTDISLEDVSYECEIASDRSGALSTQSACDDAAMFMDQEDSVHVVLFWMDGCPHCHEVIENVLPSIKEKYGSSLQILLVEIVSSEDVEVLYRLAEGLGIPKENVGVPFLMIGDHVLIGSAEIPARLPSLVETYLQSGGASLPQVNVLQEFLQQKPGVVYSIPSLQVKDPLQDIQSEPAPEKPQGFGLAIAVLTGMVLAVIYGIGMLWNTLRDKRVWLLPASWEKNFPLIAVLGIIVAAYLTYVETQAVAAVCGPIGDCNVVQQSQYARLFGVVPVGLLGLIGYVVMLVPWWIGRRQGPARLVGSYMHIILLALTLTGLLFSIYLTFLEPFVINAVCLWCLTSSVVIAALFILSLRPGLGTLERWVEEGSLS